MACALLPTRQAANAFNQPLSFDISSVYSMYQMFFATSLSDANKALIRCAWTGNSAFDSESGIEDSEYGSEWPSMACQDILPSDLALVPFAPKNDPAVGVLLSTGEVFFNSAPSSFEITIVAPRTGTYEVALQGRAGSEEFDESNASLCTHPNVTDASYTDSFDLCTSDPSKAGAACTAYQVNSSSVHLIDLKAGVNTLWLASRELCSLASQLSIAPLDDSQSSCDGGCIGGIIVGCFVLVLICTGWLSGAFAKFGCPSPFKKPTRLPDPNHDSTTSKPTTSAV